MLITTHSVKKLANEITSLSTFQLYALPFRHPQILALIVLYLGTDFPSLFLHHFPQLFWNTTPEYTGVNKMNLLHWIKQHLEAPGEQIFSVHLALFK